MIKLFLSYRRTDSKPITVRIHALLEAQFGVDTVFIDTNLGVGSWLKNVMDAVNDADACIVVIGPDWLTAADPKTGAVRLFELGDVVRREVEQALLRPLTVIVLVDGAEVPNEAQLPATIRRLPDMQAFVVRADEVYFEADVKRVAKKIKQFFNLPTTDDTGERPIIVPKPNRAPLFIGLAVAVILLFVAALVVPGLLGNSPLVTPTTLAVTENTTATATLIMTTPPQSLEVVTALTQTLPVVDTLAPTITPLPPTPSETPTFTPNAIEREATLRAMMVSIQNEQTLTQAAQDRATADSLTAIAESWTNTPVPPTPDDRATAVALLAATETQARANQTAIADRWTDTPTVTPTPTHTPTLDPVQLASTPVASNAAWEPVTQDFDDISMVLVPAGCFTMGSEDGESDERPTSEQCFTAPFWIDQTEVTQADFERLGGVKANANRFDGDARPVERITWFEARDFCALRGGRLPTEAEWEYAARGPDSLAYPWGAAWDETKAVWYGNSNNQTAIVGSIAAGASWVGALDLSGNVWEWVSSLYQAYPYMNQDGREVYTNRTDDRVLRGGSWYDDIPTVLRAADRNWVTPGVNNLDIGVRCALS